MRPTAEPWKIKTVESLTMRTRAERERAIAAAGYNTFHEQVLGAIPTLFVPNEADEMDLQASRARWAELTRRGRLQHLPAAQ